MDIVGAETATFRAGCWHYQQPEFSELTHTKSSATVTLQEAIVDTTGAGDAFIGTMVYGVASGLDPKRCLLLAAVVAATKCTAVGARSGLPHAHRIQSGLLR